MLNKTIFLVAVVAVSSIFAQGMNFGVRAGLNLASVKEDDKEVPEYGNIIGFHVGAIAYLGLNELFYFQPGFFLSKKGAENSKEESGLNVETTMSLWYLEIPLLASAKIDVNDLALRINAGPYLGFGITGDIESKVQGQSKSEEAFKKGNFKRLDFGLAFGGGVEFQNFYAGINYNLGLSNIADREDNDDSDIYSRSLGFTLGYNF